jgi:hypothetical protein
MSALLCVALLVQGFGEKEVLKRIEKAGDRVLRANDRSVEVSWPPTATEDDLGDLCDMKNLNVLCSGKRTLRRVRQPVALEPRAGQW